MGTVLKLTVVLLVCTRSRLVMVCRDERFVTRARTIPFRALAEGLVDFPSTIRIVSIFDRVVRALSLGNSRCGRNGSRRFRRIYKQV